MPQLYNIFCIQFSGSRPRQGSAELRIVLCKVSGSCAVTILKEPQGFSYHLARRIVAAGLHFGANEFLLFGRKGNVHGKNSQVYLYPNAIN